MYFDCQTPLGKRVKLNGCIDPRWKGLQGIIRDMRKNHPDGLIEVELDPLCFGDYPGDQLTPTARTFHFLPCELDLMEE